MGLLVIGIAFWVIEMNEEKVREICDDLDMLYKDNSLPKNLRRGAKEAKKVLINEYEPLDVRIASAISLLDDLASDPNMPLHGRPSIWGILGKLEGLTQ
jgi:uncharacterized protein (UPF0147 family)